MTESKMTTEKLTLWLYDYLNKSGHTDSDRKNFEMIKTRLALLDRAECEMRYLDWSDPMMQDGNEQRHALLLEIQKALS